MRKFVRIKLIIQGSHYPGSIVPGFPLFQNDKIP